MTCNATLRAAIAVRLAHQRHAAAVECLRREKARRDTQAQKRAQRRVDSALHDLMRLEREARNA